MKTRRDCLIEPNVFRREGGVFASVALMAFLVAVTAALTVLAARCFDAPNPFETRSVPAAQAVPVLPDTRPSAGALSTFAGTQDSHL